MSNVMRKTLVIGACAAGVTLNGCALPGVPTPTPSHRAIALPAPASASPPACANPDVSATKSPVTTLALMVGELPSGGPVLKQISDGRMNKTVNTDQRGFANAGNTYRLEDDVVLDASTQTATADYPQLRDAAKGQFATVARSASFPGLGCQADEYIGKTAVGYTEVGIAFQEGDVIAVVLIVNSTGAVDPLFAAAIAQAQDRKIVASTA